MILSSAQRSWLLSLCAALVACSSPVNKNGRLVFEAPPFPVVLDEEVVVAVSAVNAAGDTISSYVGTVQLSGDSSVKVPSSYRFVAEDEGRRELKISFSKPGTYTVTAKDSERNWVDSKTFEVKEFVYSDPPANTGKIRLERDTSAPGMTLKLVAAVDLKGYAAGFDLPLAQSSIMTSNELLTPGNALNLGAPPLAAGASVGRKGPLTGTLVTGVSQKAAGAGAVTTDTEIKAGQVFYAFRVQPGSVRAAGVVFDGANLGPRFRAALRDRLGQDVVKASDFAIGRLELR